VRVANNWERFIMDFSPLMGGREAISKAIKILIKIAHTIIVSYTMKK